MVFISNKVGQDYKENIRFYLFNKPLTFLRLSFWMRQSSDQPGSTSVLSRLKTNDSLSSSELLFRKLSCSLPLAWGRARAPSILDATTQQKPITGRERYYGDT
ncbi:hypothetical protein NQ317_018642 [Molorchus minor]|uniref:Uncharacterized protein n=1 Tax=Molorchus minor TaxID=1323400 RepID=A0ABQ9JY22_9CUCU|nr:hypothetical protein NQ317_018642 [Molorchus minor]